MNIFEWYHRHAKVDALHTNNSSTVPLEVALCLASTRRQCIARIPSLARWPAVPEAGIFAVPSTHVDLVQRLPDRGSALSPALCVRVARAWAAPHSAAAALPVLDADAVVSHAKLMHERAVDGALLMDGAISVGEAVLLSRECKKASRLFLVDGVLSVPGAAPGVVFLLVRELTAVLPADGALLAEAYPASLDTHVRYAQAGTDAIIRASSVWAKVFTPRALSETGLLIDDAVVFSALLERGGSLTL